MGVGACSIASRSSKLVYCAEPGNKTGSVRGVERVTCKTAAFLIPFLFEPNPVQTLARGELKPTNPLPTHELNSVQDYPPNLSILLSGGKETNKDGPSNGE